MNNFQKYASKELTIFHNFVEYTPWFKSLIEKIEADNTGFHDIKCLLKNGQTLIVEIKEDERYWYDKTGNVGLDYISAFRFLRNRQRWTSGGNYWVVPTEYSDFLKDIDVKKWGKLKTCDAHIQLFYVKRKFAHIYDNRQLQSTNFINYLNATHRLRINKKSDYNLTDNWESAAYFLPIDDDYLRKIQITDATSFEKVFLQKDVL